MRRVCCVVTCTRDIRSGIALHYNYVRESSALLLVSAVAVISSQSRLDYAQ